MRTPSDFPIAGLQKSSLVDFPGLISAVVFTPGCNYDCFYCHNRELLLPGAPRLDTRETLDFLKKRRGLLDGVVVSGGEPTLQAALAPFLRELKAMGYRVKLDTNASRPETLGRLIEEGLLDYVAADYKAPFVRYREICGPGADADSARESFKLLACAGVPYELRTTVVPQLSQADLRDMAGSVEELPAWVLQLYRAPSRYKPEDRFRIQADPWTPARLKACAETLKNLQPQVSVRA